MTGTPAHYVGEGERSSTRGIVMTTLQRRILSLGERLRSRGPIPDAVRDEIRFAARRLWRSPGFTVATVLTLALGVGATTAIFSIAYGVLLKPLPYADPPSLVVVQALPGPSAAAPAGERRFSAPELADWVARGQAFESHAFFSEDVFGVTGATGLETVLGSYVSGEFFETLGQPLALGRPLAGETAPEAVVSHRFWRTQLGRRPDVLGRPIRVNDRLFTIVGVAAPDFALPSGNADLWIPSAFLRPAVADAGARRTRRYRCVARLKPGVSLEQARADTARVARSLAADYPKSNRGVGATVAPLGEYLTGSVRPALLVLLAAVGLALLVACANVANLLLLRSASRSREIAVRAALGASRRRLAMPLLAEGALLALAGATAAVAVAHGSVAVLLWLQPEALVGVRSDDLLPRAETIRIDAAVLLFALAASLGMTLLATLAPAIQSARRDPGCALQSTTRVQTGAPAARRFRSALVVVELAVSVVLLVGAGLLARSFVQLLRTDVGAATDRVVTLEMNLAMGRTLSNPRQIELAELLLERIGRLPGVEAAGVSSMLPLRGPRMRFAFRSAGDRDGPIQDVWMVNPTPGYFQALGIPLLSGRLFSDSDGAASPPVMILSAGMARRFFGTADPIGRSLPYNDAPMIVGVVGDVRYGRLDEMPHETLYRPFAQQPFRNIFLAARTAGDPAHVVRDLRSAIHAADPDITIGPVRTLDAIVSDVLAQPRFRAVTLAAVAGLALALAALGLYGVIAWSVSQRTAEIGVRMALGARPSNVMMMVIRDGAGLALAGTGIGIAAAHVLSRALESVLYGVAPTDALSYVSASGFLLIVVVVATWVPARRASRVDPVVALRAD
jgi:putative ABC transport system permease protein